MQWSDKGPVPRLVKRGPCVVCGAPVLVAGLTLCDTCLVQSGSRLGVSDIADAIVQFDQAGVPKEDRMLFWRLHGVQSDLVQAAEEEVELRYHAAALRRSRYRGW
jgi:hypothetical protein